MNAGAESVPRLRITVEWQQEDGSEPIINAMNYVNYVSRKGLPSAFERAAKTLCTAIDIELEKRVASKFEATE